MENNITDNQENIMQNNKNQDNNSQNTSMSNQNSANISNSNKDDKENMPSPNGYNVINYDKFNTDMVAFVEENNITSPNGYLLTTSLKNRYTYIFDYVDGKWKLKYKWICDVGKPETPTVKGIFSITGRKPGFGTSNYWVKYATRFIGRYYYHSILYNSTGEYVIDDTLGEAISHGCIRLATENAHWIYDHIPDDSVVIIQ